MAVVTRRSPFGRKRLHADAWEAKFSLTMHSWVYEYGRTRRQAIRKLKKTAGPKLWERANDGR